MSIAELLHFLGYFCLFAFVKTDFDICRNKPDGSFFPVLGDCSRYYSCVDQRPYEYKCPSPYLFNRKTNICDWPDNVKECDIQCSSTEGVTQHVLICY